MRTTRLLGALSATIVTLSLAACGSHSGEHASAQQQSAAGGPTGMAGMNMTDVKGDGREPDAAGYTLGEVTAPQQAGESGTLTFTITGPTGKPHKEFVLELTKLMHTYLVRQDLTGFQHVHPELDTTTGTWSVPITFAEPGPYRLVTEFEALTPDGNFDARVLGTSFTVRGGEYQAINYQPTFGNSTVDGYDVALEPQIRLHGADLTLKISKGGAGVSALQPYLESWAHVTGFRSSDLKVVHMHPTQGPGKDPNSLGGPQLNLASLFTEAGKYRLFVQFQTGGQLHTAVLDLEVLDHEPAADTAPAGHSGHSGH